MLGWMTEHTKIRVLPTKTHMKLFISKYSDITGITWRIDGEMEMGFGAYGMASLCLAGGQAGGQAGRPF
jgi:hypothetical protein